MKANETRFEEFLSSSKTQFFIPVYQRNYDWTVVQCKQLLSDIKEVGANKKIGAHFIGSIVYVHDDLYTSSRTRVLTIIDGQQRLTTLTLIYLALYHLAKQMQNEEWEYELLETYLINKFAPEEDKLKLKLTKENEPALKHILRGDEGATYPYFSKIINNFDFFKRQITQDNYNIILDGLSKLMFVEISLDRQKDNPQRIFESLNSTGLDLSQADLIRNYILMGLSREQQNKIYTNYWELIEKYAKDETNNINKVSDFIRDYLTIETKNILNKSKIYVEFKNKHTDLALQQLEAVLAALKSLATHYNKLVNPKKLFENLF